jgi:cytochrome c551/c552
MRNVSVIASFLVLSAVHAARTASADEPVGYGEGGRLLAKYHCNACHAIDEARAGPALRAIAARYASDPNALGELRASVRNGNSGVWGTGAMAAADVPESDLTPLLEWILSLR